MLNLVVRYTHITGVDAGHPWGSFKNLTSKILKDGTPFEKDWPDDLYGFFNRVMTLAGATPSGTPDDALDSQIYTALQRIMGRIPSSIKVVNTAGTYVVGSEIGYRNFAIDATAGAVVLELPAADSAAAEEFKVWRLATDVSGNSVSVDPAGAHTVDGVASQPLIPGEGYIYLPDGTSDYKTF